MLVILPEFIRRKARRLKFPASQRRFRFPRIAGTSFLRKTGEMSCTSIFLSKAKNQGWSRFGTITNRIANEDIDGYLVYRRMHPTHVLIRGHVGIFQRNLGNFDEKVVLDNRRSRYTAGCVNCHTFCNNRPDKVLIGVRTREEGDNTLLIEPETVNKLKVKLRLYFLASERAAGDIRRQQDVSVLSHRPI